MISIAGCRDHRFGNHHEIGTRSLLRYQGQKGARLFTASKRDLSLGSVGASNACAADREGRFLVVADARLDGKAQLAAEWDLDHAAGEAEFILAAWLRHGAEAPSVLYGDYAFAIWDSHDHILTLVRDALGQRPLFFLEDGSAFASRADAFAALNPANGRPCEDALAARLAFTSPGRSSHFSGVKRVLPGEMAIIHDGRVDHARWWRPSTTPVRRIRPEEAVTECRRLLDLSVGERIAGSGPIIATHLSAGLDSSVATAIAARLMPSSTWLHAYTAAPACADPFGRFGDESDMAALAADALPRVAHHRVVPAGDPLRPLTTAAAYYQQPLPNPHNHIWAAAINDAAREQGASRLLIGQTGNYSFSMAGDPHRRIKTVVKRLLGRTPDKEVGFPLLSRDTSVRAGEDAPPSGGAERRLHFLSRLDPAAFLKGTERVWGFAMLDPFADRRLVEFSLSIPEQVLAALGDRGLGRPVARPLLPAAFVDYRPRGFQSADWIERLRAHADGVQALIDGARDHAILRRLLDIDAVVAAASRLRDLAIDGQQDERLYRVDLPWALATMAFVHALSGAERQFATPAWRGTED